MMKENERKLEIVFSIKCQKAPACIKILQMDEERKNKQTILWMIIDITFPYCMFVSKLTMHHIKFLILATLQYYCLITM